jgi:hypothetical protein
MKIPGFLDQRELKKMCIYAYCNYLLEDSEAQAKEGKGTICIKQSATAREKLLDIHNRIEKMNYTHKRVSDTANTIKSLKKKLTKWYNTDIAGTVKRYFKPGDKWIPSVLVVSLLGEMKLRGHKEFEDIDFLEILSWYEEDERSGSQVYHQKCVSEIMEKLYK